VGLEYLVVAVRRDASRTRIVRLTFMQIFAGGQLGERQVASMEDVARLILGGARFLTGPRDARGLYVMGAEIEVYLRTKQGGGTRDNLDSLPED
jgi:hypothetical protein